MILIRLKDKKIMKILLGLNHPEVFTTMVTKLQLIQNRVHRLVVHHLVVRRLVVRHLVRNSERKHLD